MIRMEKSRKLTPSEVVDKVVAFFGPGGLDLEMTERAECCVRLEGGVDTSLSRPKKVRTGTDHSWRSKAASGTITSSDSW
jgi:hypothetical protein